MSLEDAVKAAFRALLAERLRKSVAIRSSPRIPLTANQREELAKRVRAQIKALGKLGDLR